MEYKLEDLLLKTVSQLDDNEKSFIKENREKLGEEDAEAYKDFLQADETSSTEAVTGEENKEGSETPVTETPTPEPTPSVEQPFTFKSEDEAKEFVRKQTEENQKQKQAAMDAATTPEEKKYIDENWKPDNWLAAKKQLFQEFKEDLAKEEQEKQEKENAAKFEKQWLDLAAEQKLPSLETKEGKQIHWEIVNLMRGFGKYTFKEGHELWKKVKAENPDKIITPSEAGAALAEQKKAKVNAQKAVAAKMGGSNQGASTHVAGALETPAYDELHKARSVSELLRNKGVLNG